MHALSILVAVLSSNLHNEVPIKIRWLGTGRNIKDSEVSSMDDKILIREFRIGAAYVLSTGDFENYRWEASITCGGKVGATEEEFKQEVRQAQEKLKQILVETYLKQLPKKLQKLEK